MVAPSKSLSAYWTCTFACFVSCTVLPEYFTRVALWTWAYSRSCACARAARLDQAHCAPAAADLVARQGRANAGERRLRPRRAPAPRAHRPRPPAAAAASASPEQRQRAPCRAHSRALQVRPRCASRLRALTAPTCALLIPCTCHQLFLMTSVV